MSVGMVYTLVRSRVDLIGREVALDADFHGWHR
jgi:hypothetical protein